MPDTLANHWCDRSGCSRQDQACSELLSTLAYCGLPRFDLNLGSAALSCVNMAAPAKRVPTGVGTCLVNSGRFTPWDQRIDSLECCNRVAKLFSTSGRNLRNAFTGDPP